MRRTRLITADVNHQFDLVVEFKVVRSRIVTSHQTYPMHLVLQAVVKMIHRINVQTNYHHQYTCTWILFHSDLQRITNRAKHIRQHV